MTHQCDRVRREKALESVRNYYRRNAPKICERKKARKAENQVIFAEQSIIKDFRRYKGYNVAQMAAILGVGKSTLSQWELCQSKARWDILYDRFPELVDFDELKAARDSAAADEETIVETKGRIEDLSIYRRHLQRRTVILEENEKIGSEQEQ